MRVLHIIGHLNGGGAEKQLRYLLEQGTSYGLEFAVASFDGLPDDMLVGKGCNVLHYRLKRSTKVDILGLCESINVAIRSFRPDIVHGWLPEVVTIPAALMCRFMDMPFLSSQRRSLRHPLSFKSRIRDWLIPVCHLIATRVVTNFPIDKEPFGARKAIELRKGIVIRNGFPFLSKSTDASYREKDSGVFKLLFVGRLVEQKRVDVLIRAAANLCEQGHRIEVGIIGTGPKKNELSCLVDKFDRAYGLHVKFYGYIGNWYPLASDFDAFVFPTLGEGMPNVLVEAASCRLPIVTSDIFEITSFLDPDVDCLIAMPGSVEGFTHAIERLISDEQLRSRLIESSLHKVSPLTVERMAESYRGLYRSLLG